MFSLIKPIFKLVDTIYTIVNVGALLGIIFLPFQVTSSNTLRGFIALFAIIGGVLGYYLTATAWAGKSSAKCLHRRNVYSVILWLPLAIFLVTLEILNPEMAINFPLIQPIQAFLSATRLLANVIIGLGAGFTSYLLVGLITLSSPKLPKSKW